MAVKVKVEGLRDIKVALHELPKSTAKSVMRRILKARGKPIAELARSLAPKDEGDLKESITVGTKLSKRQRRKHRKFSRDDVEVFVGPGPHPQAHLQEFGSRVHGPHPFMRPAWDARKHGVLEGLKDDLWEEIRKTAERRARRAAKAKG